MKTGEKGRAVLTNRKDSSETYVYDFETAESGAFGYGNKTCVVVRLNSRLYNSYDTRYFNGGLADFINFWYKAYMNFTDYSMKILWTEENDVFTDVHDAIEHCM